MITILKKAVMVLSALAMTSSCTNLDRYPLADPSSETWFTSETQFDMSIANIFRPGSSLWWANGNEAWSDDFSYRDQVMGPVLLGTVNSQSDTDGYLKLHEFYQNRYKCINRCNEVISNIEKGRQLGITESKLINYEAIARFTRACMYAQLVFHFGDVVYVDNTVSIEAAKKMSRTPKNEVLEKVWSDFDFAIENLPVTMTGLQTVSKGAALAMKSRYSLYFGNYEEAAKCAQAVIDLDVYRLHPDYYQYFLENNDKETIFCIPAVPEQNIGTVQSPTSFVLRAWAGGTSSKNPTWALLATYECIDGKRIDESPLFNPKNPFENRDPRCSASIIPFGSRFFDLEFDPRPSATKVMNYATGKMVKNLDNYPFGNANCSYNGLYWKKRVRANWVKGVVPDNDLVIIRLADVYLMYAEAMIEQNKIDQSVLDAINLVRARAYGAKLEETDKYPAITTTNQAELRKRLRRERRVEFAFEGLRYYDLIRWHIAHKMIPCRLPVLFKDKNKAKANEVNWFWPYAPTFDENEKPNFDRMIDEGYCRVGGAPVFPERQYLWPIPVNEILANPNIKQNPGY